MRINQSILALKEKHNIDQIEKEAQNAYDSNKNRIKSFLKTQKQNNLISLDYYIGRCIHLLQSNNTQRSEIEKRTRAFVKDRNKIWISKLQLITNDDDLCKYLLFDKDKINKYIVWLQDEINWWSKHKAMLNQLLYVELRNVYWVVNSAITRHKDLIEFFYDLFSKFGLDDYKIPERTKARRERIRKEFVDPFKYDHVPHGLNIYQLGIKLEDEKSREKMETDRKINRSYFEPIHIKINK